MKSLISILTWSCTISTSLCLLATMLTTCRYIELAYFNNYYLFDISLVTTMVLWTIKQIQNKSKEWIESILCMIMGFGTMIFMMMKIY